MKKPILYLLPGILIVLVLVIAASTPIANLVLQGNANLNGNLMTNGTFSGTHVGMGTGLTNAAGSGVAFFSDLTNGNVALAVNATKTLQAFVETTGNDSNAVIGSESFPFATIPAATSNLNLLGGGVVNIGAGTFAISNFDIPGPHFVFRGINPAVSKITFSGPPSIGGVSGTNTFGFNITNSDITIERLSIIAPGGYATNVFYFPITHFTYGNQFTNYLTNIVVQDCEIIGASDDIYFNFPLPLQQMDMVIQRNHLVNSWDGIAIGNQATTGDWPKSHVEVLRNVLDVYCGGPGFTNAGRGMIFFALTNLDVMGNIIHIHGTGDTNIQGISFGGGGSSRVIGARVFGNIIVSDDTNVAHLRLSQLCTAYSDIPPNQISYTNGVASPGNASNYFWSGAYNVRAGSGLTATTNLDNTLTLTAGQTNILSQNILTNGSTAGQVLTSVGGLTVWTNVPPSATPTLSQVLIAGDDAGNTAIVNIQSINSDGGAFTTDGSGNVSMNTFSVNGGNGQISAGGDLTINSLYSDSGGFSSDASGNVFVAKLTSTGGVDPPYTLFDAHTRAEIKGEVLFEVPTNKWTGAAQFWDSQTHRMEIYCASEDKFYDLFGNVLATNVASKKFTPQIRKQLKPKS